MSINKVILIGNCTAEPKIMMTKEGREIANFNLVTNESWKNKNGEKQERAEFHKIICFSQGLVNVIKNYVQKGSKLYIEGQLQTRKYTDKDGTEKYITEIILQNYNSVLQLLNNKSGKTEMGKHDNQVFDELADNLLDDEIPF